MLELRGAAKHFGGVRAVDDVSITVPQGTIFGLIGPNGSGKSTTVNLITGLYPLTAGSIVFRGEDITELATHRRIERGIARTFQNIRLFGNLTVWQNLWVAENAPHHKQAGFVTRWLARVEARRAGRESFVRRAAPTRVGACARGETDHAPPRRAGGRNERRGNRRVGRAHPQAAG
jgi:branched-chain amino acid transport system ATP-binding protein